MDVALLKTSELTTKTQDTKILMEDVRIQLDKGIVSWNQWRDRHPRVPCQFDKQDLSEGFFFEGNFSGASFKKAILTRACLIGANLQNTNLQGADLRGAYLSEADLCGADLRNANLAEANLQGADLRNARLEGAILHGVTTDSTLLSAAGSASTPHTAGLHSEQELRQVRALQQLVNRQTMNRQPVGHSVGQSARKTAQKTVGNSAASARTSTTTVELANGLTYQRVPGRSSLRKGPLSPKSAKRSSDFERHSIVSGLAPSSGRALGLTSRSFIWIIVAVGAVASLVGLAVLSLANSTDSDTSVAPTEALSASLVSAPCVSAPLYTVKS